MLIEVGWECLLEGSPCTPICGDGLLKGVEICDDHSNDGIGCEIGCLIEALGYDCSQVYPNLTTWCSPICGDQIRVIGEICDDND